MDRRAITAIGSSLPGLVWVLIGPSMEGWLGASWAPWALVAVGIGAWAIYWWLIEPRLHPTHPELTEALDAMIDYMYLAENRRGITQEGREREHAPQDYRERWYAKLGLPKPKPHRSPYR